MTFTVVGMAPPGCRRGFFDAAGEGLAGTTHASPASASSARPGEALFAEERGAAGLLEEGFGVTPRGE
jgi:hypothetical protein